MSDTTEEIIEKIYASSFTDTEVQKLNNKFDEIIQQDCNSDVAIEQFLRIFTKPLMERMQAETIREIEKKLNEVWHKRTFVTGNIVSQWEREKAYKDGWEAGFQKARKTIGELP